jgi:hypothetical protein
MGTSVNDYSSLIDATEDLNKRGYTSDFKIVEPEGPDESCYLESLSTGNTYSSDELTIREHYRFEGPSNPDDMSVVYAVESKDGERGVIIDAFGTYSSRRVAKFIQGIPIELDSSQTTSR